MPNIPYDHISIVVFGASGDLANKMTYPALYSLYKNDLLPRNTHFIGTARSKYSTDKFRNKLSNGGLKVRFIGHLVA